MAKIVRNASHAGSWYEADGNVLGRQLDEFLEAAGQQPQPARALIVPHAGYRYSGPAAAWGYKNIDPRGIKRVFLLGPSHHVFLRKCALSRADAYRTPVGDLPIDQAVYQELDATGQFVRMDIDTDENEHSLEMHLPYIRRVFGGREDVKLVPIMVGALPSQTEALYGGVLAKYMDDPENLFVVSSDFCHWGKRFDYTPYDESHGPIHKSIEALDRMGMELIESRDVEGFTSYLKKFKNTICGRHPIGVFLNVLRHCQKDYKVLFTRYEQSSACQNFNDSSVSYASAVIF